jgi:L,D-peptidoglycan transpeptidase YkuD (ErfK/YbiS/YcfS/YnhG family)
MKKPTAQTVAGLTLTGLLAACSGHKHTVVTPKAAAVKPQTQIQSGRQMPLYYLPPPPAGERTVEDVLQIYGEHTTAKLKSYFAKARVPYPPREITLVALKQEMRLELWARDSGEFRFIRDYRIRAASGVSGPKLRQGDLQVPEGVYRIAGLNPNSHYHLSMKLDYPNEFDLFHAWQEGRTNPGSDIFIHGRAKSLGCLAMDDETIEELFVLAVHTGAQNVKVVIAPHDPRTYPLAADIEGLPEWTPQLYSIISREIKALSPVAKSVNSGL